MKLSVPISLKDDTQTAHTGSRITPGNRHGGTDSGASQPRAAEGRPPGNFLLTPRGHEQPSLLLLKYSRGHWPVRGPPAAPWPALPLSWRVNKLPSKFIPGQAPTEATPQRCYLPPNLKTRTGLTGRKHVVSTPMNCHHTRPIFSLAALPNFPNCSKQDILKITWPEQFFSSRHTKAVQSQ